MENLEMSEVFTALSEMSGILLILSGKSGLKLFIFSCIFACFKIVLILLSLLGYETWSRKFLGSELQNIGLATEKARRPYVVSR